MASTPSIKSFLKGPTAKKQRAKRKAEIRKLDRECQQGCPQWCVIAPGEGLPGHWTEQACRHHVVRRRVLSERWKDENSIIMCMEHHTILHTIGDKAFFKKYFIAPL